MSYTLDLEKLTDEQLEAFKIIDATAYKTEKENRSTYSDEEIKNFQPYTDLDRAYYYLKPMYDNMRNTDVKKTITESGILTTIEKMFRWTKKKNFEFARYTPVPTPAPEPVKEAPAPEPVKEEIPAPVILPEGVKPEEIPSVVAGVDYPVTKMEESTPTPTPAQSTVETMSTEELNKIMASIPAVEKI